MKIIPQLEKFYYDLDKNDRISHIVMGSKAIEMYRIEVKENTMGIEDNYKYYEGDLYFMGAPIVLNENELADPNMISVFTVSLAL